MNQARHPDLSKPWLLWVHDPCQEGGWSVTGFDTYDAAEAAAKTLHILEEKKFQDMVEFCKKDGETWKRSDACYDGSIVTPGFTSRLDVGVS